MENLAHLRSWVYERNKYAAGWGAQESIAYAYAQGHGCGLSPGHHTGSNTRNDITCNLSSEWERTVDGAWTSNHAQWGFGSGDADLDVHDTVSGGDGRGDGNGNSLGTEDGTGNGPAASNGNAIFRCAGTTWRV